MYENQMMKMLWCLEGYVYETRIVNKRKIKKNASLIPR